jgi:S-layer homology domain
VPPTGFGYAAIETCYNRGIVSGIGGGLFQPNGAITRAQLARMLYRAIRQPLLS